jgi:hypothetical protein
MSDTNSVPIANRCQGNKLVQLFLPGYYWHIKVFPRCLLLSNFVNVGKYMVLALPSIISQGLPVLPVTNLLAYYLDTSMTTL